MQIQRISHDRQSAKLIPSFPIQLLQDANLKAAVAVLPSHYNFQIYKTIHRINKIKQEATRQLTVALQFPQGLFMFATIISDILETFTASQVVIMGDLAYGACCIDDLGAQQLQADLLVHYGHSCLVPITVCKVPILYVFVEIIFDHSHLLQTIRNNFTAEDSLHLLGTIQFGTAIAEIKEKVGKIGYCAKVPQEKPRSPGEVLGCTSPSLEPQSKVLFVCDGRFHLQSVMIRNPSCKFYQYNPYSGKLTVQKYEYQRMRTDRSKQLQRIDLTLKRVCIILGTLGRQGNMILVQRIIDALPQGWSHQILLVSELNPSILDNISSRVSFFVQTCCPRLSIDWLYELVRPVLNSFEFFVLIKRADWQREYAMDYYSWQGGEWRGEWGKARIKIK